MPDAQQKLPSWRTRLGRIAAPAVAITLIAVLLTAHARVREIPAGFLPPAGFPLDDAIARDLPNGASILVVAESCNTCVQRRNAYMRALAVGDVDLLIVVDDQSSAPFGPQAFSRPEAVSAKVVSLDGDLVSQYTRVRAVPVMVQVDKEGRVSGSGATNLGWFSALVEPRNWVAGWRGLLGVGDAS